LTLENENRNTHSLIFLVQRPEGCKEQECPVKWRAMDLYLPFGVKNLATSTIQFREQLLEL